MVKHQDVHLDANAFGAGDFERHLLSASSGAATTPTGVAQGNPCGAPGLQLPDQMNRSKIGKAPDDNAVPPMPSLVPTSSPQFSGPFGPAGENIVPSAPGYKHKIHEAETDVIEPIPHIKDLRYVLENQFLQNSSSSFRPWSVRHAMGAASRIG